MANLKSGEGESSVLRGRGPWENPCRERVLIREKVLISPWRERFHQNWGNFPLNI